MEQTDLKWSLECPSCREPVSGVDPRAHYVKCGSCGAVIDTKTAKAYFPGPKPERPAVADPEAEGGKGDPGPEADPVGEPEDPDEARSVDDEFMGR